MPALGYSGWPGPKPTNPCPTTPPSLHTPSWPRPLILSTARPSCPTWAERILAVYDVNGDGFFDEQEFVTLYRQVHTVKGGAGEEAARRTMVAAGAVGGRLDLDGFVCFLDMQYGNLSEANFNEVALRLIHDANRMKAKVASPDSDPSSELVTPIQTPRQLPTSGGFGRPRADSGTLVTRARFEELQI